MNEKESGEAFIAACQLRGLSLVDAVKLQEEFKIHLRLKQETIDNGHYEMWKCKDGRVLRVCDMSDEHVRNTLNMILKNARRKRELKKDLKAIREWADEALNDDAKWGGN